MSYQTDALRTKSDQYHVHPVTQHSLMVNLMAILGVAVALDPIKKAIFYGKPYVASEEQRSMDLQAAPLKAVFLGTDLTPHADKLHAIIGIITEIGELLKPILEHIYDGTELDKVNLAEEYGDIMWYVAVGLADLDQDLDETKAKNIAKLRARFPEAFSSEKAINRTLDEERRILEA